MPMIMFKQFIYLGFVQYSFHVTWCHDFVASGQIRAAIGKAQLLVNKKFKQFRGLCEKNLVS